MGDNNFVQNGGGKNPTLKYEVLDTANYIKESMY